MNFRNDECTYINEDYRRAYKMLGIPGNIVSYKEVRYDARYLTEDTYYTSEGQYKPNKHWTNTNIRHRESNHPDLCDFHDVSNQLARPYADTTWFLNPDGFGHGDYAGCILTKSNLRSFIKMVDEEAEKQGKKRDYFGVFVAKGYFGFSDLYLEVGKKLRWGQWIGDLRWTCVESMIFDQNDFDLAIEEGKWDTWAVYLGKEVRDYLEAQFPVFDMSEVTEDALYKWFCDRDNQGDFYDEGSGDNNMHCNWKLLLCDRYKNQGHGDPMPPCVVTGEEMENIEGIRMREAVTVG